MSSLDTRIRALEREGEHHKALAERVRAGLVIPKYTTALESFNPWDLVSLRGVLGCHVARSALAMRGEPCPLGSLGTTQHDLADWLVLVRQAAGLCPPARVSVACAHRVLSKTTASCPEAADGCTGKVTHDTPAERYLLVATAHAVAQECLSSWEDEQGFKIGRRDDGSYFARNAAWVSSELGMPYTGDSQCEADGYGLDTYPAVLGPRKALDACAAWIACPCPEHQLAWQESLAPGSAPSWVTCYGVPRDYSLHAAAEIFTPTRVREVAAQALLEVL